MALSSWDIFALNKDSEPIRGYAENHNGVGIEIYKNWIYIHDEMAKRGINQIQDQAFDPEYANHRYNFTGSVAMQLQEGFLRYGGWDIYVERGPKNGAYVVAESHQTDHDAIDDDGKKTYPTIRQDLIVGCGVYGYMSDFELYREELEADGINVEDLEQLDIMTAHSGFLSNDTADDEVEFIAFYKDAPEDKQVEVVWSGKEKNPIFVGVNIECTDFLQEVIVRSKQHIWSPCNTLDEIDLSRGLRFNPGDAFFADNVKELDVSATAVGEAETPLLGRILEKE